MTTQPETIRGTVRRVFFSNPTSPFMAGVLALDGGGEARFNAKLVAQAGDKLELIGSWGNHPKFGRQFDATSGLVKMDESPEALAHLLASDDRFRGLGPVRARKVVDAALALSSDGSLGTALKEYPTQIADRAGVQLDIVQNAAAVWNERRTYFDALAALTQQGWSGGQAQSIVRVFGENAPAIVKENPYMLIGKVPRFGFRTVDAIALKMGVAQTDPQRLAAGVAFCIDRIGDEGNTWTTREALLSESMQELRPNTHGAEDAIRDTIDNLIAEGRIHVDRSPLDTEIVADARMAKAECEVFEKIMAGLQDPCLETPDPSVDAPRRISLEGPRAQTIMKTLNAGQLKALRGFANFRIGVISGGAGVGKTYTMKAVCEVAEENGLRVALCAPTGKAARKLSKATNRKAQTIHRLLEPGFDETTGEFRFSRHQGWPVEADLVVIDEISMADVRLMRSTLAAIPASCRLLLVGDHNQIPSVSAGAILRDILAAQKRFDGAVHILNEIVRQAGVLARNTTAVLGGLVTREQTPPWRIQPTERGNEDGAAAIVATIVEALVTGDPVEPYGRKLDIEWDIQVLAPMRKGPLGTYILNVHLQRLRQRLLGAPEPEPTEANKPPKPLVGDRVIWTENDYELDLLNGTQAIVTDIKKDGAMDLFTEDGREVTIPGAKRVNIEVAYAMTIHKAQGSEWPCVVATISSSHFRMADRNLLYTGISRASEGVVILGDMQGIGAFAQHRRSTQRETFGKFLVHGWSPTWPKLELALPIPEVPPAV